MSEGLQIPTDPIGRKLFGHLVGIGANPDTVSQALASASELKADAKELKTAVIELSRNMNELNSNIVELNRNLKGGI